MCILQKSCEKIAQNIFGHLGFQSAMKTGPLRVGIFQKSLKPGTFCIFHFQGLRAQACLHSAAHTQQAQGTIKNFKIRKDIIDKNPGADKEMFPSSAAAD